MAKNYIVVPPHQTHKQWLNTSMNTIKTAFFMNSILKPPSPLHLYSHPLHWDRPSQPWPAHAHREDQTRLRAAHFHRLVPGMGPRLLDHRPSGESYGWAWALNLHFWPFSLTASWSKLPLDRTPSRSRGSSRNPKLDQYKRAIFNKAPYCPNFIHSLSRCFIFKRLSPALASVTLMLILTVRSFCIQWSASDDILIKACQGFCFALLCAVGFTNNSSL